MIWTYFSSEDSMGRGLGWFLDLVVIGFVYGILVVLRTPILWLNIRRRMMVSLVILVLTDITMLYFVLTGILGKE